MDPAVSVETEKIDSLEDNFGKVKRKLGKNIKL